MSYFVCLVDCEHYARGDIIVAEAGPPGAGWASFEPPAELSGTPELTFVEDDGSGDLVFKYRIEGAETRFVLKARVGFPRGQAIIPERDPRPEPTKKQSLQFGAGAATTSGRGVVRWGKCRPVPRPREPWDPGRWAREH